MTVSVSTSQLRILVVAIVVAAFGGLIVVSIDDGRAVNVSFAAEPRAGVFTPASGDSAQPLVGSQTSAQALDYRHGLAVLADNQFAAGTLFAERRDPDDVLATMATIADIYDDIRMSPIWPDSLPSRASLTPSELVRLLGICGGVALGIYGLLVFNLRRRRARQPRGRGGARAP
jgi:hypothetical protein